MDKAKGPKPFGTQGREAEVLAIIDAGRDAGDKDAVIAARLTEGGYRTRRGTPYSRQYVRQLAGKRPARAAIVEVVRCGRQLENSLDALWESAQTDASAALVHAAILGRQKAGAGLLDAVKDAEAVDAALSVA